MQKDEVAEACQHTWPSMDRAMSRKCMRCGVSEQEVFDQKRAETFADIGKAVETERTMHNAWRKRAEEAEAELNALKAAQQSAGVERVTVRELLNSIIRENSLMDSMYTADVAATLATIYAGKPVLIAKE